MINLRRVRKTNGINIFLDTKVSEICSDEKTQLSKEYYFQQ